MPVHFSQHAVKTTIDDDAGQRTHTGASARPVQFLSKDFFKLAKEQLKDGLLNPQQWAHQLKLWWVGDIAGYGGRIALRAFGMRTGLGLFLGHVLSDELVSSGVTVKYREGDTGIKAYGYETIEGLTARSFILGATHLLPFLGFKLFARRSILLQGLLLGIGSLMGEQFTKLLGSKFSTGPLNASNLSLRLMNTTLLAGRGRAMQRLQIDRPLQRLEANLFDDPPQPYTYRGDAAYPGQGLFTPKARESAVAMPSTRESDIDPTTELRADLPILDTRLPILRDPDQLTDFGVDLSVDHTVDHTVIPRIMMAAGDDKESKRASDRPSPPDDDLSPRDDAPSLFDEFAVRALITQAEAAEASGDSLRAEMLYRGALACLAASDAELADRLGQTSLVPTKAQAQPPSPKEVLEDLLAQGPLAQSGLTAAEANRMAAHLDQPGTLHDLNERALATEGASSVDRFRQSIRDIDAEKTWALSAIAAIRGIRYAKNVDELKQIADEFIKEPEHVRTILNHGLALVNTAADFINLAKIGDQHYSHDNVRSKFISQNQDRFFDLDPTIPEISALVQVRAYVDVLMAARIAAIEKGFVRNFDDFDTLATFSSPKPGNDSKRAMSDFAATYTARFATSVAQLVQIRDRCIHFRPNLKHIIESGLPLVQSVDDLILLWDDRMHPGQYASREAIQQNSRAQYVRSQIDRLFGLTPPPTATEVARLIDFVNDYHLRIKLAKRALDEDLIKNFDDFLAMIQRKEKSQLERKELSTWVADNAPRFAQSIAQVKEVERQAMFYTKDQEKLLQLGLGFVKTPQDLIDLMTYEEGTKDVYRRIPTELIVENQDKFLTGKPRPTAAQIQALAMQMFDTEKEVALKQEAIKRRRVKTEADFVTIASFTDKEMKPLTSDFVLATAPDFVTSIPTLKSLEEQHAIGSPHHRLVRANGMALVDSADDFINLHRYPEGQISQAKREVNRDSIVQHLDIFFGFEPSLDQIHELAIVSAHSEAKQAICQRTLENNLVTTRPDFDALMDKSQLQGPSMSPFAVLYATRHATSLDEIKSIEAKYVMRAEDHRDIMAAGLAFVKDVDDFMHLVEYPEDGPTSKAQKEAVTAFIQEYADDFLNLEPSAWDVQEVAKLCQNSFAAEIALKRRAVERKLVKKREDFVQIAEYTHPQPSPEYRTAMATFLSDVYDDFITSEPRRAQKTAYERAMGLSPDDRDRVLDDNLTTEDLIALSRKAQDRGFNLVDMVAPFGKKQFVRGLGHADTKQHWLERTKNFDNEVPPDLKGQSRQFKLDHFQRVKVTAETGKDITAIHQALSQPPSDSNLISAARLMLKDDLQRYLDSDRQAKDRSIFLRSLYKTAGQLKTIQNKVNLFNFEHWDSLQAFRALFQDDAFLPGLLKAAFGELDADFLQGKATKDQHITNPGSLLKTLRGIWKSDKEPSQKEARIAKLLRRTNPQEVKTKVLGKRLNKGLKAAITKAVETPATLTEKEFVTEILADPLKAIVREERLFSHTQTGSRTIEVSFDTGAIHRLSAAVMGTCTVNDKLRYFPIPIKDRTRRQIVGYALAQEVVVDPESGKKAIALICVNPRDTYMNEVDAKTLYEQTMQSIHAMVTKKGYSDVFVPIDPEINSNREQFQKEFETRGYETTTIPKVTWNLSRDKYNFTEVYRYDPNK